MKNRVDGHNGRKDHGGALVTAFQISAGGWGVPGACR